MSKLTLKKLIQYVKDLQEIKEMDVIVKCLPLNLSVYDSYYGGEEYCYRLKPKLKRSWMYRDLNLRKSMYDEIYTEVLRKHNDKIIRKIPLPVEFVRLRDPLVIKLGPEEVLKIKSIALHYAIEYAKLLKPSDRPDRSKDLEKVLQQDIEASKHIPGIPRVKQGKEMTLFDVLMLDFNEVKK